MQWRGSIETTQEGDRKETDMKGKIAVGPGDGIGPEIVTEGVKVLQAVSRKYGHEFALEYFDTGGVALDKHGTSLTEESLELCRGSDAILFGAVGGPKWDYRANLGLLRMRREFGLFANLRPVKVFPAMVNCSTVKPEVVRDVDLMVLRENTGGVYFGQPKKQWQGDEGRMAVDSMVYSEHEIERIIRVGFELARTRRKKLTSADKENVLETSRLWRKVAEELRPQYPDVEFEHMLADACAMWLMRSPRDFDVIVMANLFGDVLSDEASILGGSLGMLPSAELAGSGAGGKTMFGLYESSHGSAPTIAGKNIANPVATILSVSMMLKFSFGLAGEAEAVDRAVEEVLKVHRTPDIMEEGKTEVGTREMGDMVAGAVAAA